MLRVRGISLIEFFTETSPFAPTRSFGAAFDRRPGGSMC